MGTPSCRIVRISRAEHIEQRGASSSLYIGVLLGVGRKLEAFAWVRRNCEETWPKNVGLGVCGGGRAEDVESGDAEDDGGGGVADV